jgi:two-component system, cell cycle response regulator DivK
MSIPFSSEHLSCLRDDARRLVAQVNDHEDDLEALVRAVDTDVHPAEAARRACVSAREQHVLARRLLEGLDLDQDGVQETQGAGRRRPAAVLVVDDYEDVRELIARVLRDAGFIVRTAVNGLDALIAAYEMQPTVIVMDMTMPVLDGFEATRLIKATQRIGHAKIIAYTGNPILPDDRLHQLFAAVVTKPATPDVVLAAVRDVASL